MNYWNTDLLLSLGWWFYWLVFVLALLVLDGVVLLYRSYCRLET